MIKIFEILNVEPKITKTKTFNLQIVCENKTITKFKNAILEINCFDKSKVVKISTLNNKRTKTLQLNSSTKPKWNEQIILFETSLYGFDIDALDIKYEGFIKENIKLILDQINILFNNFNLQYNSQITPSVFSIFRILDSLKITKASELSIFDCSKLEEFYPEVFEIEGVTR